MAEKLSFGDNVAGRVDGTKLTLEIDLSAAGSPSASGKTTVLASSRGNQPVGPGVFLGINVFRKITQ
jgi:hypothetical protein